MQRRRFVFWVGFGLFGLAEKLRASALDDLAAAIMQKSSGPSSAAEHWRMVGNNTWRWYERESLVDGKWRVSGITSPIHRVTGEPYTGKTGYLDESLVPASMRQVQRASHTASVGDAASEDDPGRSTAARRARHGRPPSKWLRSLHADELRIWLRTLDPPEAGVEGMTFFEHLTRDHSFDATVVNGLTETEQAKLHAAAHAGY